jgi:hypothetical protein
VAAHALTRPRAAARIAEIRDNLIAQIDLRARQSADLAILAVPDSSQPAPDRT